VHIGSKWATTRRALSRRGARDPEPSDVVADRRQFLATVFGVSALLTVFTVGQTVRPLARLALLAPRRPDVGPQGFPVNRTAAAAGVTAAATDPGYRLIVEGRVRRRLELTLDGLNALEQHDATLPIACVDGWSASKTWSGVPVRDLLQMAGAPDGAQVTVHSLQRRRAYRSSELDVEQAAASDTLLALRVGGEPLHLDHGYPLRLIAPNRPGVMQTKWVTRLVVT
jgi:DMSO/TMAO reductase YedYZ molybdopterin-dependent catalytic subunit